MTQEPPGQEMTTPDAASVAAGRRPGWRRVVHWRLLLRLVLPALIGLVMLGLAAADIISGLAPPEVILALAPGLIMGYPLGRLTKVAWNSDASQIVQDGSNLMVLFAYLALRFGTRAALPSTPINGPYVSNVAAFLGVGLLLGRTLGLAGSIRLALRGVGRGGK